MEMTIATYSCGNISTTDTCDMARVLKYAFLLKVQCEYKLDRMVVKLRKQLYFWY